MSMLSHRHSFHGNLRHNDASAVLLPSRPCCFNHCTTIPVCQDIFRKKQGESHHIFSMIAKSGWIFTPLRARWAARRSLWSDRYLVCDTEVTVIRGSSTRTIGTIPYEMP